MRWNELVAAHSIEHHKVTGNISSGIHISKNREASSSWCASYREERGIRSAQGQHDCAGSRTYAAGYSAGLRSCGYGKAPARGIDRRIARSTGIIREGKLRRAARALDYRTTIARTFNTQSPSPKVKVTEPVPAAARMQVAPVTSCATPTITTAPGATG